MKKSYCCKKLESTIHFFPRHIKYCCSLGVGPDFEIKNFNHIDRKVFEKYRNKYINKLKQGIIPEVCKGCPDCKEKAADKKNIFNWLTQPKRKYKISHIIINHYRECDCNCIYCSAKLFDEGELPHYDLVPAIKDLFKFDLIDKENLCVEIQGGNISMLKEFENIIDEFQKNGCSYFVVLMNGIKYVPALEKISKDMRSSICVSLDAGTKETFAKIKQVDAFEQTIENLKKLRQKTKIIISLKYIIIKEINDNIEELKKFLDIAKEIIYLGAVTIDIDYRESRYGDEGENYNIPELYCDLINYAEKYCKENKINFEKSSIIKKLLKEI